MARKIDRALGAFCLAFSAFFVIAGRSSADGGVFSATVGAITLWLALLAAVPGIWLLIKGRSV